MINSVCLVGRLTRDPELKYTGNNIAVATFSLAVNRNFKDANGDTLVTIIVLACQLDLDVTECLSIAYEEIKNRKGKMVNGTFIKEEDL